MIDYDEPSVYREEQPKARKDRKCYECRRTINPGEVYVRFTGMWDEWRAYHWCLECDTKRHAVAKATGEYPAFGEVAEAWGAVSVVTVTVTELGEIDPTGEVWDGE